MDIILKEDVFVVKNDDKVYTINNMVYNKMVKQPNKCVIKTSMNMNKFILLNNEC